MPNAAVQLDIEKCTKQMKKYCLQHFFIPIVDMAGKITMIRFQSTCRCKCGNKSMIRLPQPTTIIGCVMMSFKDTNDSIEVNAVSTVLHGMQEAPRLL